MRINSLSINEYRNLRRFSIDFAADEATTVLLGRNGTGKSNLIEALVEIFRDLENHDPPAFAYRINYSCRGREVDVDADPARKGRRLSIKVDGARTTQKSFYEASDSLLPSYVFAYYSGWSPRLERQFDRPTRRHYNRVLNSDSGEMPLRRMFFCRPEYSQLVLLAFFLSGQDQGRELLKRYLGVIGIESTLFVLKRPWWRSGSATQSVREEGDERFWFARGAFRTFLDRLWEASLAPIRSTESVERDVRRQPESTQRLYMFLKSESQLRALAEGASSPKAFFSYLESLFLCDLIDEVRVTVESADGHRVRFSQLSEGEQQLLTVLGLMTFTQDDEALYLLDEPDTHLNPIWTYDYLEVLRQHIRVDRGHLLIATHNPLMIGTLRSTQVRLLSDVPGQPASEPEYDPIGLGVEGLLKSEMYGLRSTLAPEILGKLDEHYRLLGRTNATPEEQEKLMVLGRELNDLGVARTHPNPYFELFANAMARRRDLHDSADQMSKGDLAEQADLADEILRQILVEEGELPPQMDGEE